MPFLVPLMLRIGVMPRFAKAAAWAATALAVALFAFLAWLAFTAWVADGKREAVLVDRIEAENEANNRIIAADRAAELAKQERDSELRNQQQELRIEAAKGDASGLGPGSTAVYERLRQQQAARAARNAGR